MNSTSKNTIRQPYVAGQFYPGNRDALSRELSQLVKESQGKEKCLGVVSPHAGYMYSGKVAGELFSRIELNETIILIGPNHTGLGKPYSLMARGSWSTPLGTVAINEMAASEILNSSQYLEEDFLAHEYEHSVEVQIPFIQYFKKEFEIIPIVIAEAGLDVSRRIGEEISRVIKTLKTNILIIASSDMTHYESQMDAEKKDKLAIEAIIKLDEKLLYERIKKYDITMCGYAPCIIMLSAAKQLGAKTAELVKYQTSANASGDYSSVVGYAGIMVR